MMDNRILESIMQKCSKPARYIGGEYNTPNMDKISKADYCICFPDNYEVAMSNLGIKILYHLVNEHKDYICQRCFAPWEDFGRELKSRDISLFSLETKKPLKEFDFLGFSFQYELSYTNFLYMLDLAKIPPLAKDRNDDYPIVMAGGPCMCNPYPIADFCDVVVIGEGEEVLIKLLDLYKKGMKKSKYFELIKDIDGVYLPNYQVQKRIKRVFVKNLDESFFPTKPQLAHIDIVHDRGLVELFRGCTRGCRFCQAGMIYRPIRERSQETVAKYIKDMVNSTGYDEISLNSLSTGDYPHLRGVLKDLSQFVKDKKVQLSLPSLRLDSFTKEFAEKSRKSSLTFAPEAGTQRLRDVINKNITEQDFLNAMRESLSMGYTSVKLYFMIGLPTETLEDLDGIAELALKVRKVASELGVRNIKISVSCSTFIPKPFTPFQWCAQDSREKIEEKQRYLSDIMRRNKIVFNYHDTETSILEAFMSRGDRKLSKVLLSAYENGAKFDGWSEFFNFGIWKNAISESGLDIEAYIGKRDEDADLPWDNIDIGVSKEFLLGEYKKALNGKVTNDCRNGCHNCGLFSEGLC